MRTVPSGDRMQSTVTSDWERAWVLEGTNYSMRKCCTSCRKYRYSSNNAAQIVGMQTLGTAEHRSALAGRWQALIRTPGGRYRRANP